jgi:hypothetical protein
MALSLDLRMSYSTEVKEVENEKRLDFEVYKR